MPWSNALVAIAFILAMAFSVWCITRNDND